MDKSNVGFTLVELLIALSLMGIIATFTIPKMLQSNTQYDHKMRVRQAAAMIATAYQSYREDNTVTGSMKPSDLTPYLNYVKYDSSGSTIIDKPNNSTGSMPCDSSTPCVILHNGAAVMLYDIRTLGSVAPSYSLRFWVDPDSKVTGDGSAGGDGLGKAVSLYLYATNGRIVTRAEIDNPTYCAGAPECTGLAPMTSNVPPWFNWE